MHVKANQVVVGDYIMGYGRVVGIHRMNNEVADLGPTMTERPKLQNRRLLRARIEAEAEEQCYYDKLASIVFDLAGHGSVTYRPDDRVRVACCERVASVKPAA